MTATHLRRPPDVWHENGLDNFPRALNPGGAFPAHASGREIGAVVGDHLDARRVRFNYNPAVQRP